ncbi:hypothetical protein [Calidithermus chliarophilus]|uniref:hypothetical protein n=1 Tax=Calidithermus chliarophilus TaxID=52023 RepID=UPI0004237D30|nr:hypothetical protein [Calidithermus chliarophilus]
MTQTDFQTGQKVILEWHEGRVYRWALAQVQLVTPNGNLRLEPPHDRAVFDRFGRGTGPYAHHNLRPWSAELEARLLEADRLAALERERAERERVERLEARRREVLGANAGLAWQRQEMPDGSAVYTSLVKLQRGGHAFAVVHVRPDPVIAGGLLASHTLLGAAGRLLNGSDVETRSVEEALEDAIESAYHSLTAGMTPRKE